MKENKNVQTTNENKPNNKSALIIIIIVLLILLGIAGYFLFIRKGNDDSNPNINYDILNYQCKEEFCNDEDYDRIKELLKTDDKVRTIFDTNNDQKIHALLLENVSNGNVYFYSVDNDKYYFKNDSYFQIDVVYGGDEKNSKYVWDNDHVIVREKTLKHFETTDLETFISKVYSLKDDKIVFEGDDYYECTYARFKNKLYYELSTQNEITLYDEKFNNVFDIKPHGGFDFDEKYIFGTIEKDSKIKVFRYNIENKKIDYSKVVLDAEKLDGYTYNYIVKEINDGYEVFDFDGNSLFKTDEKTNLKNINAKDYTLPFIPQLYYSKANNTINLILEPDVCGAGPCPPYFGYSYYEYNIDSNKVNYKFFVDEVSEDVRQNLYDGYVSI